MVYLLIKTGQMNPKANPEDLYKPLSRTQFTKHFIQKGMERYDEFLEMYKETQYVALAVDAGKEGSHNYFDMIIANPFSELPPLVYNSVKDFKGDMISYEEELRSVLNQLISEGFIVTGIVSDNLRVQVSAIEKVLKDFGCIVHIPCGCHTLELALKDAEETEIINEGKYDLEWFSRMFNRKHAHAALEVAPPKRCATRWSNLFAIAEWIVRRRLRLIQFCASGEAIQIKDFQDECLDEWNEMADIITTSAPIMFTILLPFAHMIKVLEGDGVGAFKIYGYMMSTIANLKDIVTKVPQLQETILRLIDLVLERLNDTESGLTFRVMHDISARGREVNIQIKQCGNDKNAIDEIWKRYYPINISEEELSLIDDCKVLLENSEEIRENIVEGFEIGNHKMEEIEEETQQIHPQRHQAEHFENPVNVNYNGQVNVVSIMKMGTKGLRPSVPLFMF
ncbi:hypothetical protein TVAG_249490 [Trichomonas vaginalis G3]|uniref:DUF659 domain-containing protein n=1 Tax=Trichomonas vaginalis (strain ATCC PRA-98 / G3) TaxID=412133 RepID=A2DCF2_TRIV3|nr:ribonuclease H-like family [Trichomonas vaginalis G3]EAY21889.1 hypothetical protein TVAG_249490 [Trichomonas vaginalis G3]KAI5487635.1 ribonuclease H-like family [Trichomonas vaginalis G3]|eukprot:XP_001582875.1 hypothetical protein [Trichomonas vaginalis G3]